MDSQKKKKKTALHGMKHTLFTGMYEKVLKKMIRYDQDLSIIHETILLTFLRVLGRSNLFNSDDQFMTNKREKNNKIKLTALTVYGTWYRHVSSPAMGSQGRLGRLRPVLPDG